MKRHLLLLLSALLGITGAWAATLNITPSMVSYTSSANYYSSATFSSTPVLTVTASANNMDTRQTSTYLLWHSGSAKSSTYTLSVPANYVITAYSITGQANSNNQTLTSGSTTQTFTSAADSTFTVSGLTTSSAAFTLTGNNTGLKITAISVTLASTITDLSELRDDKAYVVTNKRGRWTYTSSAITQTTTATAVNLGDVNQQTVIYKAAEGEYYIYSVAQGKFVNSDKSLSATPQAVTIESSGDSDYPFFFKFDDSHVFNGGNGFMVIDSWTTKDDGNRNAIIEATDFVLATIQYQISDEHGVVYTSPTSTVFPGLSVTTMPSEYERDFCSYTVTPTTPVQGTTTTVPVTVAYSLPFTISTNYADATWYYATIRSTKYARADDSYKDGSGRYQTNSTNEKTDYYKWAFFGNPYSNFYIANMGQGEGKYLYKDNNTAPIFQTVANPASTDAALWAVTVNGDGFTLRSITGNTLYINDNGNGGNLGYWNSSYGATDAGGKWNVLPVSTVEVTYNVVLNGNIIATATEEQGIGYAPQVPAALAFDYTSYTYSVDELTASTTTVTATPTFNMPFTTSTDYATATWYYLHGHATYSNRYISTNGTATVWGQGKENTDAYKWAFIGNPIQGIKVINKATGSSSYLMGTNPATMGATEKAWTLKQQTNTSYQSGTNGFGLYDATLTYVNTQAGTLKYWASFDQGSTFWVEDVMLAVTYNLVDNGTTVNSVVAEQTAYSAASVPSSLTDAYYSSTYFTFQTSGTIGNTDCTITVTPTPNAGVVTSLADLSNNKAYTLTAPRGALGTNGTQMVSTYGTAYSAGQFALISFEGSYFLYSVSDAKFVANATEPLLTESVDDIEALVFAQESPSPFFYMGMGENGVNVTGHYNGGAATGVVINNWTTHDDGNKYAIVEADDFDPTAALAILASANFWSRVESEIVPYLIDAGTGNPSATIGQVFGLSSSAATNIVSTYMTQLNNEHFNAEEYYGIKALRDAGIIYPESGKVYRVKNTYNGKYLRAAAGETRGQVLADLTAEQAAKDVSAQFYVQTVNSHPYIRTQGQYLNWVYSTSDEAYTATNLDKYAHFVSVAPGEGAFSIALGNGEGAYIAYLKPGYYALKNGTTTVAGSTTDETNEYARWNFEEVTDFTVALNGPIGGEYFATLCVPFSFTVTGAKAYTLERDGNRLTPTEVPFVDAGTPVMLTGTGNTATISIFDDSYATTPTAETSLTGNYFPKTIDGTTDYVLGQLDGKIGFYHWSSNNLKANRAYIEGDSSSSGVKGFAINWGGADAIQAIEETKNANEVIYNLAGQRVSKAVRGVYIINGKKVVKN